jgi:hypothetical protein
MDYALSIFLSNLLLKIFKGLDPIDITRLIFLRKKNVNTLTIIDTKIKKKEKN